MGNNSDAKTKKVVNAKSYQILAHMLYSDHDFFSLTEGGSLLIKPVGKLCRMLNMYPRDLVRRLTYLEKKGFIQGFTHKRGEVEVKLITPLNRFKCGKSDTGSIEVQLAYWTNNPRLYLAGAKPRVNPITTPLDDEYLPEAGPKWNPTTMRFE